MPQISKFISYNIIMCFFGFLYYLIYTNQKYPLIKSYLYSNFYHILFVYVLNYVFTNLTQIYENAKQISPNIIKNLINISKTTILEIVSILICNKYTTNNIFYDLITFIPKSFIFEIIFDFFHYWTHRISHYKYLYYYHKTHHEHTNNITVFSTYNHNFYDLIITNVLPMYLTSLIVPLYELQFFIFLIIKTFIEISGHSGKHINNSSFIQCSWIPKLFGIELYSRDHYIHHENFNYNYSKRFIIWDKIFETYKIDNKIIIKENQLFNKKSIIIKNNYVKYSLLFCFLGLCYLL